MEILTSDTIVEKNLGDSSHLKLCISTRPTCVLDDENAWNR